jgi:hypothetical protein
MGRAHPHLNRAKWVFNGYFFSERACLDYRQAVAAWGLFTSVYGTSRKEMVWFI